MNESYRPKDEGVIFANPPAKSREGQQKRGMFPLPLISLANYLNPEIKIENVSPDLLSDYSQASSILLESNAEWLAMTCYQETMKSVLELARTSKSIGRKVVLGGHHITLWGGEQALKEIPEADFVVVGEGEIPLKYLIEDRDHYEIPGLWWRENGKPKTNGLPFYFNDWAEQPPMIKGYSAFDYSELWKRNEKIGRTGYLRPISLIGIRGCAFAERTKKRCTFCAMPLTNRLRCRNPKYFWDEVSWLANEYNIDLIWDHSDSFLGSKDWLAQIAEIRPKNTPPIWCYGRADEINAKIIGSISKIGIEHIYIGVEVGSNERLREIRKGITLQQVLNAIDLCHKNGIRIQLSFIFGLPGETMETLRDTINFALLGKERGADDIVFHEFILRKGLSWFETLARENPEINRMVLDQGLLQSLLWRKFNPYLERTEALKEVVSVIQKYPHSEITAWNI